VDAAVEEEAVVRETVAEVLEDSVADLTAVQAPLIEVVTEVVWGGGPAKALVMRVCAQAMERAARQAAWVCDRARAPVVPKAVLGSAPAQALQAPVVPVAVSGSVPVQVQALQAPVVLIAVLECVRVPAQVPQVRVARTAASEFVPAQVQVLRESVARTAALEFVPAQAQVQRESVARTAA
jgi:hypothetical protein